MGVSGGPSPGSRDTARPPRVLAGLTIQSVLAVGFTLTVGVWLFSGYYFANRILELETDTTALSQRYTTAQELLAEVGNHVDRASILLRDALLDHTPKPATHVALVEAEFSAADSLLLQYAPVLDTPSEVEHADRLRRNIAELHSAHLEVLSTDPRSWRSSASTLLRGRVAPRRDAAARVADNLRRLNRDAYIGQQIETARLYRAVEYRLWETLGVGVLATLAIALLSALHVRRLERQVRTQQEREARTAVDLQRLSATLVNAQEEERRSIARELHDEVGQILTAIKMELSHAQRQIASGGTAILDDARSITDRALQAVRNLSQLLHPPQLEALGLPVAVDSYVQAIRNRQEGMTVEFTPPAPGARLPADVELAVYRTVQEALTNVVRHSYAKACSVTMTRLPDRIALSVRDDGVGFDVAEANRHLPSSGLGLIGVRERVLHLGGSLRIDTAPGKGTTLTVEFPLAVATPLESSPAQLAHTEVS